MRLPCYQGEPKVTPARLIKLAFDDAFNITPTVLLRMKTLLNCCAILDFLFGLTNIYLSVVLSFPQGRESMVQTALNWRDN
jgi:hypothetical protein